MVVILLKMSDSELFRHLSLDETLRRTFTIYAEGFVVFTKIALLTFTILSISGVLWVTILGSAFVDRDKFNDHDYLIQHVGAYFGLICINSVIDLLISAVGNIAMIHAVADIYLKRQPNFKACVYAAVKDMCPILSASLVGTVGIIIGMLLLYAPGIYLSVTWVAVTPIIVVEGLGVLASFRRSMDLVSGSWCYIFCCLMIASFFTFVLVIVWSSICASGYIALFSPLGYVITCIPSIIYMPLHAIIMTIIYINLRIEKEALNSDMLAKDLRESCGEGASYNTVGLLSNEGMVPDDVGIV